MGSLKLLAIFAHPDGESMGMGGTLGKYSAEDVVCDPMPSKSTAYFGGIG